MGGGFLTKTIKFRVEGFIKNEHCNVFFSKKISWLFYDVSYYGIWPILATHFTCQIFDMDADMLYFGSYLTS